MLIWVVHTLLTKPCFFFVSITLDVRNLEKACRVGAVYKVWVHLYGRNTFSYLVKRPETDQIAHSFTLELSKWMKSPSMPYLVITKLFIVNHSVDDMYNK